MKISTDSKQNLRCRFEAFVSHILGFLLPIFPLKLEKGMLFVGSKKMSTFSMHVKSVQTAQVSFFDTLLARIQHHLTFNI